MSPGTGSVRSMAADFVEDFGGPQLDPGKWIDHFLPHWTTPERSAARYRLGPGGLELRIEADQPAWAADGDGDRASNLQTGTWSGPAGSPHGQHRYRDGLVVISPQPARRLYTPTHGRFEATMRARADPTIMLAFWLVGFEEGGGEQSGELCVVELFGDAIGPETSVLSLGVKAHHDPRLHDDMVRVPVAIDATDWHTYAVEWGADDIRFLVDDHEVHRVAQAIDYPMQLMVDLFEVSPPAVRDPAAYPKAGHVRSVRGYPS
jgi:hypothetical protein